MSLKDICGLILAGGIGAGSVVAVQEVRQPKPRPAVKAAKPAKPAISRPRTARAATTTPLIAAPDCVPSPFSAPGDGSGLPSGIFAGTPGFDPFIGGGPAGGSGGGGFPPGGLPGGGEIPTSIVPEPGPWGMMISGFGLIGLALRRLREPVGEG